MKRKWIGFTLLGSLAVVALLALWFVVWAGTTNPVMAEVGDALKDGQAVSVNQERWIAFAPLSLRPTTGIIFYPGGKVNPKAYVPLLREIAKEGYLALIVPMPLNMAFLGINKADAVIAAYPEIKRWVIAGHSLGGAMAANLVYKQPRRFAGLILYASWPADSNSLAGANVPVLSVYGSRDGEAEKLALSAALLPPSATVMRIEGGNHAQFGYYGIQDGDGAATISRTEQQMRAVSATVEFLRALETP